MTRSVHPSERTAPVACDVGWADTGSGRPGWSVAEALASIVERRVSRWAPIVQAYLDRPAVGALVVILRPGPGLPCAKGNKIVVPVPEEAADIHDVPALDGLAHELVHVMSGRSPNEILNEGLAVEIDSRLRLAGPVWPSYYLAPRRWVAAYRTEDRLVSLDSLLRTPMTSFTAQETKSEITRRYVAAASYVGFLLERLGRARFWSWFEAGTVPTGHADVATSEREWLDSLGGPPTAEEWRLVALSREALDRLRPTYLASSASPQKAPTHPDDTTSDGEPR